MHPLKNNTCCLPNFSKSSWSEICVIWKFLGSNLTSPTIVMNGFNECVKVISDDTDVFALLLYV